jgi:peptidoglycan/LPS O-acetylase OafA/YrhL
MQGIFRYVLAHVVVLGHLWRGIWDTSFSHPGVYAVFSFYVLSGYLMALTLSRTYDYTLGGTVRFFANRVLRIYPPYLTVLALTAGLLALTSVESAFVNPSLRLPDGVDGWARNLAIIGMGPGLFELDGHARRLVPPAWSLAVELYFYVAMGLLLGRGPRIAAVWLLLSLVYTASALLSDAAWPLRYTPLAAASLPFSLGAAVYHFREPLGRLLAAWTSWLAGRLQAPESRVRSGQALLIGSLFLVHAVIADEIWTDPMGFGFYLSLALTVLLVPSLASLIAEELPPRVVALDRLLGNLSYPVFLCHWLVAMVVAWAFFGSRAPAGGSLFVSSVVFVNVLAFAVYAFVERPVDSLRSAIRPRR